MYEGEPPLIISPKCWYACLVASFGMFPLGYFLGWMHVLYQRGTLDNTTFPLKFAITSYLAIAIVTVIEAMLIHVCQIGPLRRIGNPYILLSWILATLVALLLDVFIQHISSNLVWIAVTAMFLGRTPGAIVTYITEITGKHHRGRYVACVYVFFVLGNLTASLVNTTTATYTARSISVNGGISMGLYLIHNLLLFSLKESPWHLVQYGYPDDARSNLVWLRGNKIQYHYELESIDNNLNRSSETRKSSARAGIWVGLNCVLCTTLTGMHTMGALVGPSFRVHNVLLPNDGTFTMLIIHFLGGICACFLIDRAGRKLLLMITLSVMAVCVTIIAIWVPTRAYPSINAVSMFAVILYQCAFAIGPGPIPFVIMSEVLIQETRCVVLYIMFTVFWVLTGVIYCTSNIFIDSVIAMCMLFVLYAIVCLEKIIYVGIRQQFPETTGKSLPRIQYEMGYYD